VREALGKNIIDIFQSKTFLPDLKSQVFCDFMT
jgi:hypothetical protein